ncbi:HAD family hydrolase [Tepidiforma sp.]|uniref:HAD family hydrolase n=1 Tax=Tepidiforma sp. TaxID=2682230 RepID=UPI002ADE7AA4|nr:HAD family hydrolase [Tepidiforma sp.]
MTIRAILFDWDGTLVHATTDRIPAACAAVDEYARRHITPEAAPGDTERAFHAVFPERPGPADPVAPTIAAILGQAFTWLGWPSGANDVESAARRFFDVASRGLDLLPDARALLASLHFRGYRLGVVSNSIFPGAYWQAAAASLGIAGYLQAFVTSADVGLAKPHPAPFRRALAELTVDPHDALFVGDTPATDIAGARAAGLRAVLLDRPGRRPEAAGYLTIRHLAGLAEILGESISPRAGE